MKSDSEILSVVMPLYNEGGHLYENIARTVRVMRKFAPFELIAVNDGSSDNSQAEMDRAAAEFPEVRGLALVHAGKGEALRQGTEIAQGKFVIFIDADLDLPPEQIVLFLALQQVRGADAVIGCKMHPDSTIHYPLIRRFYSRGYFVLTRLLFRLPVRDTQTGLKLVRRDFLVRAIAKTSLKGYAFDLELLVRLVQEGAKMVEAPVVVYHRTRFGRIGLRTVLGIFSDTWRTWWAIRWDRGGTDLKTDKKIAEHRGGSLP
jgi:glycosyltransferase involved in cell wall biosynthesis